jgi:hypothetical protein
MKTLQEKFNAVNENRYTKAEFLRDAQRQYPQFVTRFNGYEDTVQIFKNRGMIAEVKEIVYDNKAEDSYSPETIRRAVDIELDAMGVDSASTVQEKDYDKAKKKAMANLEKDCNHYLHLMAKESPKVDKHDKMVTAKDNNKVDTFNGMKKAELKEAMKKVIVNLLEDKQPLNEAAAEKLEQYINYENSDNQDLAARIRKGATELAAHIAKIEKMYLDTRENIEAIYEDIGSFMAPAVSNAFKEDLKPVMAKYFAIETPKSRRLSPEELEQLGYSAGNSRGTTFSLREGKIIKKK